MVPWHIMWMENISINLQHYDVHHTPHTVNLLQTWSMETIKVWIIPQPENHCRYGSFYRCSIFQYRNLLEPPTFFWLSGSIPILIKAKSTFSPGKNIQIMWIRKTENQGIHQKNNKFWTNPVVHWQQRRLSAII